MHCTQLKTEVLLLSHACTPALQIGPSIGAGARVVLFFHCLHPALPPSPQSQNLKRRVRCRHLGYAVLLLRTHSLDPGRFAMCTSCHPLAPEAYESHADFILAIDMAYSPSLVPSVMSCDPRLPRPGHTIMGPVFADPIHLTAESTLSLIVSLATQQFTSCCSRTFEYRSIEKQAYFLLLNPIPTNDPIVTRHDSGAGMMPQGYSWPTALYLP